MYSWRVTMVALLILTAGMAPAVSNQKFAQRWNDLLTIQVRHDAVRHGVDMTHVTLTFDARNHRAWLRGSVGTPWEKKLLLEIVSSSQLADSDKIVDEVIVQHYPEQWRRLRSHLSDAKQSQRDSAQAEQLLRQYDQLIAQYNAMAPSLHKSSRNQVLRQLDRLVTQLHTVEMQLENSGVFWIDETIRQLQEYRARKGATLQRAPAPAVTSTPPVTAATATQATATTHAP